VAKAEGPEEFFEALRTVREEKSAARPSPPAKPEPAEPSTERPEPVAKPIEPAVSAFAAAEPTITLRRSTAVFVALGVLVLLFIAYALGRRSRGPNPAAGGETVKESGVRETRAPLLPPELQNTFAIFLKRFDGTQDAGEANARAYHEFLTTSPSARFLRDGGKRVLLISHNRHLELCVGPFQDLTEPDLIRSELANLEYHGVRQFANSEVRRLPLDAKLLD